MEFFIRRTLRESLNPLRRAATLGVYDDASVLSGSCLGEQRNLLKRKAMFCLPRPLAPSLCMLSTQAVVHMIGILGLVNTSNSLSTLKDLLASCVTGAAYFPP